MALRSPSAGATPAQQSRAKADANIPTPVVLVPVVPVGFCMFDVRSCFEMPV